MPNKIVFTIGHSNRTLEVFIAILESFDIELLVDIRTIPRSKHNPQFNFDVLPQTLKSKNIMYRHEKNLGGLRKPQKDSINTGWKNSSFRGFADYMQTKDFLSALNQFIPIIRSKMVAFMCAEALPWRCHRCLISDALLIRGFDVYSILDIKHYIAHELTAWANVSGKVITYPAVSPKVHDISQ